MLLEYLEKLSTLDTIEEVWANHVETMQSFGFDRMLYGFTRSLSQHSFGDQSDILLLSNHDENYIKGFIDGGLYFNAPMVKWAAENIGACSWSWMHENISDLTETEKRIITFNQKFDVKAGYSISFKDVSSKSKGAIGLVGKKGMTQDDVDALWDAHGRVILQINNVAHLKLASLPYSNANKPLTARQKEVLEWVGDGKTIQDIATIMGRTPATVEKHLRLARETLNVETTAQAVFKASVSNQIFIID